jgi:hypothetical protein
MHERLTSSDSSSKSLANVPRKIFLDTCVVNFILDYGAFIHENCDPPKTRSVRVAEDAEALRCIWICGQRAPWRLAISALTYAEVMATTCPERRTLLRSWASDLLAHWLANPAAPEDVAFEPSSLEAFPDANDRQLLRDAIALRCDTFCTRDWSTILRFRASFPASGLRIMTPAEWWKTVEPWASLWA